MNINVGKGMDIGSAIKEQLSQSIKNVDVLSLLQKMVASTPEDESSEDVRRKLQGILDKYNEMSDSDKEIFVSQIKDVLASKLALKLKDVPLDLSGVEDAIKGAVRTQIYLMAGAAIIFILLLGRFYS